MSGPDIIDALVVARRILANPKTFRVSVHEDLAMAGCLIGLDEQLEANQIWPVDCVRLVAAVANFIATDEAAKVGRTADGYTPLDLAVARCDAFNTLKTLFETEFPHV